MNGYKIVLLKAIFMLYRLPECERVCSGICRLRHTFATRCIESQCDYKTVSVILGHSNVSTTLNLYVHPNLTQKKKCVERMSKFLGITEL